MIKEIYELFKNKTKVKPKIFRKNFVTYVPDEISWDFFSIDAENTNRFNIYKPFEEDQKPYSLINFRYFSYIDKDINKNKVISYVDLFELNNKEIKTFKQIISTFLSNSGIYNIINNHIYFLDSMEIVVNLKEQELINNANKFGILFNDKVDIFEIVKKTYNEYVYFLIHNNKIVKVEPFENKIILFSKRNNYIITDKGYFKKNQNKRWLSLNNDFKRYKNDTIFLSLIKEIINNNYNIENFRKLKLWFQLTFANKDVNL